MKILNWGVASEDIYFGWEPRTLPLDLKSLQRNVHIEKNVIKKNSTLRVKESDASSRSVNFFDYVLSMWIFRVKLMICIANFLKVTVWKPEGNPLRKLLPPRGDAHSKSRPPSGHE